MSAFYNEIDPYAAQWLRNLIAAGLIAPGVVDTRSIEDITPDELREFTQVHLFAGIGVWSYALRRAGWPDDKPVWTGSCPCQPFSVSGKKRGFNDERHLWPAMFHLVEQCRPANIFGEQVASADGLEWFDLVQTDLEGANYAATAFDLCAAGVGAPHIRQRLYWLAHPVSTGRIRRGTPAANEEGREPQSRTIGELPSGSERCGVPDSLRPALQPIAAPANPIGSYWANAEWIGCKDGKWRPIESGTIPLVNGAAGRVGRLRAYGNALAAPVAETFIRAYLEAANDDQY